MVAKQKDRSINTTLLEQVKLNDADGWERLVRLCSPLVYQWCRARGLNESSAVDVCQDVFVAVARGISQFRRDDDGDTFRGWLWTITLNKIRDAARKSKRHPNPVGGTEFQLHLADLEFERTRDEQESNADKHLLLRQALELIRNEFEKATFDAFLKSVLENRTAAQIGAELNMSVDAIYKAKSRVLRRLRQEFAELIS